jgi:hypothetical protein
LKRATALAAECEQWTTAGFKSIAMVSPGTGNDAKSQKQRAQAQKLHDNLDKRISGFFTAIHDLDHEVDKKALMVPATDRLGRAALADFKAKLPAILQIVQACHQELHARLIPQALVATPAGARQS